MTLALAVALCSACDPPPVAAAADVVVTSAPLAVDTYPHYDLDGHRCWLVGDRWYTRDGNNWVVYLNEPDELKQAAARSSHN